MEARRAQCNNERGFDVSLGQMSLADSSEPEYRRGIQYEGSGERVQRFLGKLSRGEAVTVSVIGGSGMLTSESQLKIVSKGRGLTPASIAHSELTQRATPTLYSPENMHVLVFDWLSNMFPGDHRFINGAQGAVGAEYFGWCFSEQHLRV